MMDSLGVYVQVNTSTYMDISITYIHTACVCVYIYIHIYICVCVCVYVCMHVYMENSPKLESMPTLCRCATLPAETTISKWRVTATIRWASSVTHRRDISFQGFKSNSIPLAPQQLPGRTGILESPSALRWEWMPRVADPYSAPVVKGMPHRSCS